MLIGVTVSFVWRDFPQGDAIASSPQLDLCRDFLNPLGPTPPALPLPDSPPRPPMVALTFDDGPGRYTNRIVDLLYQNNGRATFFVTGNRVRRNRNTILRTHAHGNEIANHSWSHVSFRRASNAEIRRQVNLTSEAIAEVIGYSPAIVRPPFGALDARGRAVLEDLGYAAIMWSIDPEDWRFRDPDRIYRYIMRNVRDGSIIVLHDIHGTTAQAMTRVIPRLVEMGFDLVTVSEMFHYSNVRLEPGRSYFRGTRTIALSLDSAMIMYVKYSQE